MQGCVSKQESVAEKATCKKVKVKCDKKTWSFVECTEDEIHTKDKQCISKMKAKPENCKKPEVVTILKRKCNKKTGKFEDCKAGVEDKDCHVPKSGEKCTKA